MKTPVLPNAAARRLFLDRHALLDPPRGGQRPGEIADLVHRLGFVQVDSINTVARAHDMILWTRAPGYRPDRLRRLADRDRVLFEHWTHDASVIPMAFLPYWKLRFTREAERLRQKFRQWQGGGFEDKLDEVLDHIRGHGPCGTGAVGADEARGTGGWWDWHPSKTAIDYLWRTGRLAVTRREGFAKLFDLAERVYPPVAAATPAETADWACRAAMDRLGFATSGELAAFFALVTPAEARGWCDAAARRGEIEAVEIEGADGRLRRAWARPGTAAAAAALPQPGRRIRVLSPFDPALRDRARAERLFGFSYRIEVFVPEPQRRYGYYVFPVLEGDRLIGRIDTRARRGAGVLAVRAFWPEPGVAMGRGRADRLAAELDRLARFAGCDRVEHDAGWLRPPLPGETGQFALAQAARRHYR